MRCITVSYGQVSGSAKNYPYYQAAEYELGTRQRDGARIWKYVGHRLTARRSAAKAEREARAVAAVEGKAYIQGIRQYSPVDPVITSDDDSLTLSRVA